MGRWIDRRLSSLAAGLVMLGAVVAASLISWGAFQGSVLAQTVGGNSNGRVFDDSGHHVQPFAHAYTFVAVLSTTGQTEAYKALAAKHGVFVVVTGSPAGCTGRLQGSADAVNFFDLDAADETCTSSEATFIVDKPAQWVRFNLKTLSGGSSPTVTVSYVGE